MEGSFLMCGPQQPASEQLGNLRRQVTAIRPSESLGGDAKKNLHV